MLNTTKFRVNLFSITLQYSSSSVYLNFTPKGDL